MSEEKHAAVTSPPRKIFWAMQYSEPFTDVYDECKKQLESEYDFITPLENQNQTNIVKKVITQIYEADFVIVDVSYIDLGEDDRPLFNGNVMFELGYAMTLPKNVIMISCRDKKYLPFDFNSYNVEFYNPRRPSDLCAKLKNLLSDPSTEYENPITDWLREPRTPHQVKEPEATEQTSKESSFDAAQLSDAALELFIAASERRAVRITATANDFVLVRDGDFSTAFSPRNLKDEPSRVLAELETVRLVAQESKGIFKVEEQDKEIFKALSDEIDLRVYREILVDNSLREFFERVQTPDALLTIKFGIAPKLHWIIAERPENRRPILQFQLPLGEVLKIGVFLQNAKLIEGWYESFPETNQRMIYKLPQVDPDAPGIRFVKKLLELDQLPQLLTGAFSERGKIICRMFQK